MLLEEDNAKWSENPSLDLKRISLLLLFVRLLADNASRLLKQMQLSGPSSPYDTRRPFQLCSERSSAPSAATREATILPTPWTFLVHSGGLQRRSVFVIPRGTQRRLARLAGTREVLGFDYLHRCVFDHWPYVAPRPLFKTVWRYRTQTARSCAELALRLRTLWCAIRWRDLSNMRVEFDQYRRSHQVALRALERGSPHLAHLSKTFFELRDTELFSRTILERRPLDGRVGLQFEYLVECVRVPYECATGALDLLNAAGKARALDDYVTFYDSDEESVEDLLAPVETVRGGTRRSMRNAADGEAHATPTRERIWLPESELEAWQIKSFLEHRESAGGALKDAGEQQKQIQALEVTAGAKASLPLPKVATSNSVLKVTLQLLNDPNLRGLCLEPEPSKQLQHRLPGDLQFLADDMSDTLERLKPLLALPTNPDGQLVAAQNGGAYGAAGRFPSPQMPVRFPPGAAPTRAPYPTLRPSFAPRPPFGVMAPTASCIEVFRPGLQRPPAPSVTGGFQAAPLMNAMAPYAGPPQARSTTLSRPLPAIAAAMQQKAAQGHQRSAPIANGEQKKPVAEPDRPQTLPIDESLLVSLLRVAVAFSEGTDQHTDLLRVRRHFENQQREKLEQSARAERAAKQQSVQGTKSISAQRPEQQPPAPPANMSSGASRTLSSSQSEAVWRRPIPRRLLKSGSKLARLLETRVVDLHALLERRRFMLESLLRLEITDELIRAYAFQFQQQLALNPPPPEPPAPEPTAPESEQTFELRCAAATATQQPHVSDQVDSAAPEVKLESVVESGEHQYPHPQPQSASASKAPKGASRRNRSKRGRNASCSSCSSSTSSACSSASRHSKKHRKRHRHRETRDEGSADEEVPLMQLQKRSSRSRSDHSYSSSSSSSSSRMSSPASPLPPFHATPRKRGRKSTPATVELGTPAAVPAAGGGRGRGRGRGRPPRGAGVGVGVGLTATGPRTDGLICASCGGPRSELSCDLCSRWFHAQCIGRSREELDALEQFTCAECAKSRSAVGSVLYCVCRQPYDETK